MLSEEFERTLGALIVMLAPITPHFASELWAGFCSVASSTHVKKVFMYWIIHLASSSDKNIQVYPLHRLTYWIL